MIRTLAVALALALASPVVAQDFSAGSEASSWGLAGEAPARFEAQVVDILCELAGDCPPDCGAGARHLGLKRTADDVLVLPMKNGQPIFTGAVADLAPLCGQTIEVDGLLVGPEAAKFYQIQRIRPEGVTEFQPADAFTSAWAEANPEAAAQGGDWFRNDPGVRGQIEQNGYLGLGLETDKAFIADWF